MSAIQANINAYYMCSTEPEEGGYKCVKCRKGLHWGDPGIVWSGLACGPLTLCPKCARYLIYSLAIDYMELCEGSNKFGIEPIEPLPDLSLPRWSYLKTSGE